MQPTPGEVNKLRVATWQQCSWVIVKEQPLFCVVDSETKKYYCIQLRVILKRIIRRIIYGHLTVMGQQEILPSMNELLMVLSLRMFLCGETSEKPSKKYVTNIFICKVKIHGISCLIILIWYCFRERKLIIYLLK